MKTKIIAGVSVNLDKRDSITYEQLMKSALTTKMYYQKKGAEKLIDKELRANGFKPTKQKSKKNQSSDSVKSVRKRTPKE